MKWELAHGKPHSSNCGTVGVKLVYTKSVSSEIRMQLSGLKLKSPELSLVPKNWNLCKMPRLDTTFEFLHWLGSQNK